MKNKIKVIKMALTATPPKVVWWAINNYCNVVCTTCQFSEVKKSERCSISWERAVAAIDKLASLGFKVISITGGEPLLHPDIFRICEYITKKGLLISYLPTNATRLNDDSASKLKQAGVNIIGLSVDLPDATGFGISRRIKDIQLVIARAVKACQKAGLSSYAGVLLKKSSSNIPAILKYTQELGFTKIVFSYPQTSQSSTYLAAKDTPDLFLNCAEITEIIRALKTAKGNSHLPQILNSQASLDDWGRFSQNQSAQFPCWGGSQLFYLDWNLELFQCFTTGKKNGNLLELDQLSALPTQCEKCTQQAFRDYGPFFTAHQAAHALLRSIFQPARILEIINNPTNRAAGAAVLEVMTKGFV